MPISLCISPLLSSLPLCLFHRHTFPTIRYSIPIEKVVNALAIPLKLRVDGDNRLLSYDSPALPHSGRIEGATERPKCYRRKEYSFIIQNVRRRIEISKGLQTLECEGASSGRSVEGGGRARRPGAAKYCIFMLMHFVSAP
ncbi:hypothetical protein EVAR_27484_1 [Eumeta japonica]|uniref:Uncharacterized protein n=1 Tax=Eumeta variegata TaxID=151549 RepID=A0A4C1XHB1_EUMVA|nr:hypothetical protein EVAR_27484_1 [Eumeta japonica]